MRVRGYSYEYGWMRSDFNPDTSALQEYVEFIHFKLYVYMNLYMGIYISEKDRARECVRYKYDIDCC